LESLPLLLPAGVDPLDKQAAHCAAIECINAADQMLRAAMHPLGSLTRKRILRCLYDLDRAWINAGLYHATSGVLSYGGGPCHQAYDLVETIRGAVADAVASWKIDAAAPLEGRANLWDLYQEHFDGIDFLWNSYKCGGDTTPKVDKVVDWIQVHIRHTALSSLWHFDAWPAVCHGLEQFSREKLDDLMGAILEMRRLAADGRRRGRSALPGVPPLWEGRPPGFPIRKMADVLRYLDEATARLALLRDYSKAFEENSALTEAGRILRNARRLLRYLGRTGFEKLCSSELQSIHDAEEAIAELQIWMHTNKDRRQRQVVGRKKADYETIQDEAETADNWARARDSGEYKAEFVQRIYMDLESFNQLLDRVAKRKLRSDK
jgi:hypothetical protein